MEKIKDERVEEIINEYFKLLFKISYNYTLDAFKAEDIVQEVFLKFYRARNTFNDDEHIKNWLIRVTKNLSLNAVKKKKRILLNDEYINDLPDNSFSFKSVNDEMTACVMSLKDNYKDIILLYYYDDLSIKEIAQVLKITETNVQTRLDRARKKLKEIIEKRNEDGK